MSERPAVILASAGSGKTHELAGRYIRSLFDGASADRILATTFTRKAAGEMFAKVLVRLTDAAATDGKAARKALEDNVGRAVSQEEARRTVIDLIRRLDRVRVQTLDSFFAEIGRVFAPELGLRPGWRILDEAEIEEAKEEAIDRVCDSLDVQTLLAILENMNGGALPMLPRQELMNRANELHEAFLNSGATTERWGVVEGNARAKLSSEAIRSTLFDLSKLPPVNTKTGSPNVHFAKARENLQLVAEKGQWDEFLTNSLVCAVLENKAQFSRADIPAAISELVRKLAAHAANVAVEELSRATRAAGGLVQAFDRAYSDVKKKQNALTFDDLPRAMLTLPREDSEWLSFRLDAKLDHILLDEFQDTSRAQYLVLEPLLREIASQKQPRRSVFAVGDVKQSLYGWRGAVPELLAGLSERLGLGTPGTKSQSWRSSEAVLGAVNSVFANIDENPALADYKLTAARWKRNFRSHTAARDISGQVRVIQTRVKDPEREETVADLVQEHAIERILSIASEHPEWSIGVLTRTNAPIPRLIHQLRMRGILAAQDKGHPLVDEPCVNALLSVLQLAEHPGDSASQFHVGKSAFAKLLGLGSPLDSNAGERVASELRSRIANGGIAGLTSWLRKGTAQSLTARGLDRLRRVETLAAEFDVRASGRIPEFIRLVEDSAVNDTASGQVSVLTIHRAKGLEWDAVLMIDLERSWKGRTPRVVVDRGERGEDDPLAPIEAVTLWPKEELQSCSPQLMDIADRSRARQIREELSGLYVSMTRARCRLEMIISNVADQGKALSSAAVLRSAFAAGVDKGEPGEITRREHTAKKTDSHGRSQHGSAANEIPTKRVALRFAADNGRTATVKSPSQRKAGAGVRDILRADSAHEESRRLGHVWHAWFEDIEWVDVWKCEEEKLVRIAGEFGMPPARAVEQLARLRDVLAGPIGQALSRERYANKSSELAVRREWGLAWNEGGVVTGRIDRLVIGLEGGRPAWAEVLDFKTDRLVGKSASECGVVYSEQMKAYRKAVAGALRLEPAQVRAALLFTSSGMVVSSD